MKGNALLGVVVVAILIMSGSIAALIFGLVPGQTVQDKPAADIEAGEVTECSSDTTPTITVSTPDFYGGAAVTTQNIIRQIGMTSTTDVAGAATFNADPADEYEILFGIDSNNDDEEPYGPKVTYTVPCREEPEIEQQVIDDSVAGDLTAIAFDPDDNNQITGADPVDIDAGDVKTIPFRWTGAFEEDFGNRFCEDNEGVGNVLVVRYNTTEFDNVYVTDMNGNRLSNANVQISRLLSASSGFTDLTFEFPVLRSNADYNYKLVLDADDDINPSGCAGPGCTTSSTAYNTSNVTMYLYDVNWFINNDVTPSAWTCGIMDEDGGETGAVAADNQVILITPD